VVRLYGCVCVGLDRLLTLREPAVNNRTTGAKASKLQNWIVGTSSRIVVSSSPNRILSPGNEFFFEDAAREVNFESWGPERYARSDAGEHSGAFLEVRWGKVRERHSI
jgi:hypothetical protein